VIRLAALLALLLTAQAHAEPVSAAGFDPHLAAQVYAAALSFMAPRTLEPVPVSQLTLWGLRGLTALDPDLTTELRDATLRLAAPDRILATQTPPPNEDPAAWAEAAANLAAAAAATSNPVRRAGTQGVVQSFFDEMFNHLDPYSRYVAPGEAALDRERRSGSAGAGLTVVTRGGAIVVQEAIADGPAALAGIRVGDQIISVDGQASRGKAASVVADWINGPEDTHVGIVYRGHDWRVHTVDLTRAMVPPETVFAERVGDMLVLHITGFSRNTESRLARAIDAGLAAAAPPDGIVVDLRGDRGGLLREAVGTADRFLQAGVVVTTAGRDPDASRVWRSNGGEMAEGMPVVVVVDGRTASAAEILAAALADRGRAVVVGSSTLGKGLVQTIDPLPDGGELFVTWSRVLAPRGWPIQGLGVLPQVCTSRGADAMNAQLVALAAGTQPMAAAIARSRAARAPVPAAQILELRSACPAAEGHDSDLDAARVLIDNPAAYAAALLPPLRDGSAAAVAGRP
jgi:carboxyl-terminal processing protease